MNCHCMVCVGSKRKNLYLGRNAIYIYFILCNASFLSRLLLPFLYLNICNSNGMVSKSCELWFFFSVFFFVVVDVNFGQVPKMATRYKLAMDMDQTMEARMKLSEKVVYGLCSHKECFLSSASGGAAKCWWIFAFKLVLHACSGPK